MRHDADRPPSGPTRTTQLIDRSRQLQSKAGKRLVVARDEHATVRLLTDALKEDRDTGGALLAGAIAFRLFLWLLPAGLVTVAIVGFLSPSGIHRDMTTAGLGGYAASTIAGAAGQAHEGRWLLLLIGLVALYSASVGLAKSLWIGTSLAWHVPVAKLRRPPKVAACVLGGLVPAIALALVANWLRSVAYALGVVVSLLLVVLYSLLGWVILRLLPRPPTASAVDLVPGAILIGVGVQVLHLISAFYLVNRISSSSQLYGALGGAATLLLWGYLLARILIGASTLNHALFRYQDPARLPIGDEHSRALSLRGIPTQLRAGWRGIAEATTKAGGSSGSAGHGQSSAEADDTDQIATLTVWRFESEEGAEQASRTLDELERKGFIRVIDAAVVTWPVGARKPRTSQAHSDRGCRGPRRLILGGCCSASSSSRPCWVWRSARQPAPWVGRCATPASAMTSSGRSGTRSHRAPRPCS